MAEEDPGPQSPEKYITPKTQRAYTSSERRIILNVYAVLRRENPDMSKRNVAERVGVLTGCGRATVERLRKEFDEGAPVTPGKKRPYQIGQRTRMKKLTDFQKNGIRRIVHSLYRENIPPTSDKITAMINADVDLPNVSDRTTRKLMNDLGFKFVKRQRRSILIEREDIVQWRRQYLLKIKEYREQKKNIFYLDETWCNAGHTVKKAWTPTYIKSAKQAFLDGETTGLKDIPGKGGRYIVVHIGNENGFLKDSTDPTSPKDARWVYKAKKTANMQNATHHDEMNAAAFESWFTGILHLLPSDSVIVMDNASYHSETVKKLPNMSWRKKEIQDWLQENGVHFNHQDVKAELLLRIPDHIRQAAKQYKIDKLAEECGHCVLRLPPYHCDLNPIELVWAKVKSEVARNNTDYTLKSVETLLSNALDRVSPEDWKKFVTHVENVEDMMWRMDSISDEFQDRVIVLDAGNDEDSEDETSNNTETDEEGDLEDSWDDLALPLIS